MGGKDVSGIDGGGLLYSFIFATANARLWDYAECGEMVRGTYAAGCRNAVWGNEYINGKRMDTGFAREEGQPEKGVCYNGFGKGGAGG